MSEIRLSREFVTAYRLFPHPRWQLAVSVGMNPSQLSKFVSGAERPRTDDPRIIAIARILGVPPEAAFEAGEAAGIEVGVRGN